LIERDAVDFGPDILGFVPGHRRRPESIGGASGLEHAPNPGIHFFLFNELAPVGLHNALPDGGTKAGIFLKESQRRILYQPLGVGAGIGSNLRKLSFLLGGEMNFHRFQST